MNPRRPLFERIRGLRRWLIPAALLALAPKCLVCVAAYLGLSGLLGFVGPEFCGAPASHGGSWPWWLAGSGGIAFGLLYFRKRRPATASR